MKFDEFKQSVRKIVSIMRQSKQTEDDKFELKKIRDFLHNNCKMAYMDYFYIEDFDFFEKIFIDSLSKAYNIPKKTYIFSVRATTNLIIWVNYIC